MADEQERSNGLLLGWVVIFLVVGGTVYGLHLLSEYFKPPPVVVSLSAYFVDGSGNPVSPDSPNYKNSNIKIRGDFYQGGKPIQSGNVRVTISTADDLFQQSISLPFQNGHFETDDPAFRGVRPGAAIQIKAEMMAPGLTGTAAIHLNSEPPVDKSALEYGLTGTVVVMAVVFFVAFTGRKTPWKNRTAIIFSYLVIAIFLAVPLLAPVILLHIFPDSVDDMIGAPAGLINTHTTNQPDGERQWALNIGGYSFKTQSKTVNKDEKAKEKEKKDIPVTPPKTAAGGTDAEGVGTSPSPNPAQPQTPNPAPDSEKADKAGAKNPLAPSAVKETPDDTNPAGSVVQVQGGLVIPLYVIILSVIGGAINMTRKVPGFQKEGEESDFSVARPISRVGRAVMSLARMRGASAPTKPNSEAEKPAVTGANPAPTKVAAVATIEKKETTEVSLEDQAKAVEAELEPLVTGQILRSCETDNTLAQIRNLVSKMQELYRGRKTDEPLLRFNSFEDWAASHPRLGEMLRGGWRVELLNQYMYLISAPFLAIVTYYILDLLGLSKQGVIVVLSFSVGLVSEKIVTWILGIATGYLRTDTSGSAAKKV